MLLMKPDFRADSTALRSSVRVCQKQLCCHLRHPCAYPAGRSHRDGIASACRCEWHTAECECCPHRQTPLQNVQQTPRRAAAACPQLALTGELAAACTVMQGSDLMHRLTNPAPTCTRCSSAEGMAPPTTAMSTSPLATAWQHRVVLSTWSCTATCWCVRLYFSAADTGP